MYKLTEINIYPVKSLSGYSVKSAVVTDRGLQYDRRWMLVDESGKFLTQRSLHKMSLLKAEIKGEEVELWNKINNEKISFSIDQKTDKIINAIIWDDIVTTDQVSELVDQWLCDNLNTKCSLVYMPDSSRRMVDKKYSLNNDITSLSDAYPFLIIGEQSLNDLNSRLTQKISMDRFRTNFVFSGGISFDEDKWRKIQIGQIMFYPVKPCSRCAVPTIDPSTGERGNEPLTTLSLFRKVDNKIYFGQNMLHSGVGEIEINTEIKVLEWKP
ncbi:MAG: MOSC domain-containing protein [Melioribacteraceae bacterium]|jgi:uncharacterized protein YcbX|nr:MOSC domain-containing protein [Melioribacteraceae bacterium]